MTKKLNRKPRVSFQQFSKDFKETFGSKLELISKKEDYINLNSFLEAKCSDPSHKPVIKKAVYFRRGMGCINCKESQGERLIRISLEKLNIEYVQEKRFASCRDKKELPFDFYLPHYCVLIEFQGFQHFKKHNYFGGEKEFKSLKKRDFIKKQWAKENKIPLLEINSYKEISKKILFFIDKFSKKDVKDALNNLLKVEKEWTEAKWNKYLKKLYKTHPDYDFSNTSWQWGQKNINYYCAIAEHGLRNGNLQALLKGHGCSRCAGQDINLDDIKTRSKDLFGNKFDFSKANFIDMVSDIEITCDIHGSIFLSPEHHLRLANGCVECSPQAKPKDDEKFLERTKKFNGRFEYFYDEFTTQEKILILCKKHNHKFKILQGDHTRHMTGGCKYCVEESKSSNKGTSIVVEGKEYSSISKAAKAYGLKSATVRKRLRNGKSISEAFNLIE